MDKYSEMGGGGDGAASALEGGDQSPPENAGGEESFTLPEFQGVEKYQPGDTIQLKVVGQDQDGMLQVECIHDEDSGGGMDKIKNDFRSHMGAEGEGMQS